MQGFTHIIWMQYAWCTLRHLSCQLGQAEATQQGKAVLQLWAPDSPLPLLLISSLSTLGSIVQTTSVYGHEYFCLRQSVTEGFLLWWQGNNTCKVFKPRSHQTTGHKHHWWSSRQPHCIRKIPLTTSGRVRIVLISSLTLRSFQTWLNKALEFYLFVLHILPLRNWSFLSKSLFWLSLTVSSANCPRKTKTLCYGVVRPPGNEQPPPQISTTLKASAQESQNKECTDFIILGFLVPKFKLKNHFWQNTSARFAQAGILL